MGRAESWVMGNHLGLMETLKEHPLGREVDRAIVHGDPDRVPVHASLLEGPDLILRKRGFITYIGRYNGVPITITTTGIGSGSASIALEELAFLSIRYVVRVGTCGSYRDEIKPGDIVIPEDVLMDGPPLRYLAPNYVGLTKGELIKQMPHWVKIMGGEILMPSSSRITKALVEVAEKTCKDSPFGLRVFHGTIHDKDVLHAWNPRFSLSLSTLEVERRRVRRMAIATDMESCSIFTIARLRGIEAGAILTVVNFTPSMEERERHAEGLRVSFRSSLEAITSI